MTDLTPTAYATMRAALEHRTWIEVWCAWCGQYLHTVDGHGESGRSDGICPACLELHFPEVTE